MQSWFQSTFPRGERPDEQIRAIAGIKVSIHVPARGTTCRTACSLRTTSCFNPRSREGNDVEQLALNLPKFMVSIHVPARGTTLLADCNRAVFKRFNPRSREGNDGLIIPILPTYAGFNPRSREGNDLDLEDAIEKVVKFQSTFPRGERLMFFLHFFLGLLVSIHVPARGTTISPPCAPGIRRVSIHVPARGTTFITLPKDVDKRSFNPRSREGND